MAHPLKTLLPLSATRQEIALEFASAPSAEAQDGVEIIRTVKSDPLERFLWPLIWEYGLEEIIPYISDRRAAIAQGIEWQRIRGTPASLLMALGWIDGGDAVIEEEETGGAHWAEFMLDPGFTPNGNYDLERVKTIARMSAPVGSVLQRVFHGYDIRRFKLDHSQWGDLLSDYSGWRDADGLRVSFGRVGATWLGLGAPDDSASIGTVRYVSSHSRYADRALLDVMILGDKHVVNNPFVHFKLHTKSLDDGLRNTLSREPITFAKLAVVLDDGLNLGDLNCAFGGRRLVESGERITLSGVGSLSGDYRSWWVPIDERFERSMPIAGLVEWDGGSAHPAGVERISGVSNTAGYNDQSASAAGIEITHLAASQYRGQFWTGVYWPPASWADLNVVIGTNHYGDTD